MFKTREKESYIVHVYTTYNDSHTKPQSLYIQNTTIATLHACTRFQHFSFTYSLRIQTLASFFSLFFSFRVYVCASSTLFSFLLLLLRLYVLHTRRVAHETCCNHFFLSHTLCIASFACK